MGDAKRLGTVGRVVHILRVLAEADRDVTIAGIADLLDLPRPTVHRLLSLLAAHGMVAHDTSTRRYGIGPEFFRVAALVAGRQRIAAVAWPIMQRLVAETDETSLLSIYRTHDRRMAFVAQVRAAHALGYMVEMQQPLSLVWGASGRVMLAFLPKPERLAILHAASDERAPTTGEHLPRLIKMLEELDQICADGYGCSLSQRIPHAYSVAAPVLVNSGEVVGSLSVTLPEMRLDDDTEGRVAPRVVHAARELSELLGLRPVADTEE
jgi:DNA-binding IclR family transcriptional regulator